VIYNNKSRAINWISCLSECTGC